MRVDLGLVICWELGDEVVKYEVDCDVGILEEIMCEELSLIYWWKVEEKFLVLMVCDGCDLGYVLFFGDL